MKQPQVSDYEAVLSRMEALCSKAEHCEQDIRGKMRQTDLSDDEQDRLIENLYNDNFLNAERYCRAYALDQFRFAGWGRLKIAQALRMKGLPDIDIRTALDEIPEEEYLEKLQELLDNKRRTLTDEDEYQRQGKLVRFAAGRGFEYDKILNFV